MKTRKRTEFFNEDFFKTMAEYESLISRLGSGIKKDSHYHENRLFGPIDLLNRENLLILNKVVRIKTTIGISTRKHPKDILVQLHELYSCDYEKSRIVIFYLLQFLEEIEVGYLRHTLCNEFEKNIKMPLVEIFSDLLLFKRIIER
jgi:hypothetical protein